MSHTLASPLDVAVLSGTLRDHVYSLDAPTQNLILGRHSNCDIVFPTNREHVMVGRVHAIIQRRPEGTLLLNLHGNGTFLNQTLLGEYAASPISENDIIQLGQDGPRLALRQAGSPRAQWVSPPPSSVPPAPVTPPPESVARPDQAQELFYSFSKHLLDLNDSMEESRDASIPAQAVLDRLEVIVSRLAELRMALGIRPR
jgi:hypothetical protein